MARLWWPVLLLAVTKRPFRATHRHLADSQCCANCRHSHTHRLRLTAKRQHKDQAVARLQCIFGLFYEPGAEPGHTLCEAHRHVSGLSDMRTDAVEGHVLRLASPWGILHGTSGAASSGTRATLVAGIGRTTARGTGKAAVHRPMATDDGAVGPLPL